MEKLLMEKLLKLARKYDTKNFIAQITGINRTDFEQLLNLFFSSGQTHIYHQIIEERSKRDDFFHALIRFCQQRGAEGSIDKILTKYHVISCTELLFDEIKKALNTTELSKLPSSQQFWALISRVESEVLKIEKNLRESIQNRHKDGQVFTMSERFKVEFNGEQFDPDFVIEQILTSLSRSITLLGYQNEWFNDAGALVVPSPVVLSTDLEIEAAEVTNLALAWLKLEAVSARCMLFEGEIFLSDLTPEETGLGITKGYHFHQEYSEFERYEFISQRRYIDKHTQNFFENMMEFPFKDIVADSIDEIKSINGSPFISADEINTLIALASVFGEDIFFSESEYHGLTVREWVRAFHCLIYFVKNTESHNIFETYSKEKFIDLFVSGGLSEEKANTFINLATFSKSSRDLYDRPLLAVEDGRYYIFRRMLNGFSVYFTILSVFSSLKIILDDKGKTFEELIFQKIRRSGVDVDTFKFKRGKEEYQYDSVFVLDDKLFVVECKNTTLSGWNAIRGIRFKNFIDETVSQINRLVKGLNEHPEVIEEKFGRKITDFEIIPIIINALPFSYPGKYKGVYISDASSFGHFLSGGTVSMRQYQGTEERGIEEVELLKTWSCDTLSANDLINHLNDPIQLKVYDNNIQLINVLLKASNNVIFTFRDFQVDLHKGFESTFSEELKC